MSFKCNAYCWNSKFGLFLLTKDIVTVTIVAAASPLIQNRRYVTLDNVGNKFPFENIGTIDEGKETISKKPTVIDAKNAENLSVHKAK